MPTQRSTRQLNQSEKETISKLYAEREDRGCIDSCSYVTTTEDLILNYWNGEHPFNENMREVRVSKGATLRIVMVSRFGDCGLSEDLDAYSGYGIRLSWDDAAMTDIRLTRQPSTPDLFDSVSTPRDCIG